MHKILALWATPRSTSTAFEWMMRMRGDMACFHEPFGEAWYQGEDARWPRIKADSPRIKGLTFNSVWQELKAAAAKGPSFSKDFPHYIEHLWSDAFLDHFNHSFLIRDPAKVATSMYKHWPDFVLKEIAFVEQRKLFDRLADKTGETPPVIDSDDLLENPHGIVEAYCDAVGIPYIDAALSWEPGKRDEVSWYDGGSWHANLANSDGLKAQTRQYIDISEAPDRVKEIYHTVLPHYEHLHAHRLAAGSALERGTA
ncbi:MAG: sulfotransferase family protein [Gammaproteobacteria bacterium]|nr:sulfotransferase family protein [Gammaproteobacteria bacterium]